GEAGGPSGADGLAHGAGHEGGVGGAGDGGGEQDGGAAELHGLGGVGGGADARVADDRHFGLLADEREVVGVANAQAGADGRGQWHDGGAAGLFEAAGQDRVVVGVGQDGEALADEGLGGVEELDRVGQQGVLVADDLEFDPVGAERLAGQAGGADGLFGGAAPGGVGQDADAAAFDDVQDRAPGAGVDASEGDGDQFGARGGDGVGELGVVGGAAGAEDEPGAEVPAGDRELVHGSASLGGGEDLDGVAVAERAVPFGAGDDLAVDGDGGAAPEGGLAVRSECGADGVGDGVEAVVRVSVEFDLHGVSSNRSGSKVLGRALASPAARAATCSAVAGRSAMPCR